MQTVSSRRIFKAPKVYSNCVNLDIERCRELRQCLVVVSRAQNRGTCRQTETGPRPTDPQPYLKLKERRHYRGYWFSVRRTSWLGSVIELQGSGCLQR